MSTRTPSEFSRFVAVSGLHTETLTFRIEAEPAERAALSRRFGLVSLERLCAEGRLVQERHGLIRLQAQLKADVIQLCVISLEPVISRIDVGFERLYSTALPSAWDVVSEANEEVFLSAEDDDPPDPVVDGSIDIGETVAEQLALEINPFPKAPGAELSTHAGAPRSPLGEDKRWDADNPFARLAALRTKLRNGG